MNVTAARCVDRCAPVQIGRDTIEEAEPQIVLRLRVVIDAAVVAAARPLHRQGRGKPDLVGDLARRHAGIGHAEGLVMEEPEHVALRLQERDHALVAPGRPMMRGEDHLHVVAEHVERLLQWSCPR
jgi:hypothetical protein